MSQHEMDQGQLQTLIFNWFFFQTLDGLDRRFPLKLLKCLMRKEMRIAIKNQSDCI